jgi:alkylated DNA repair dioxygenase AlkB
MRKIDIPEATIYQFSYGRDLFGCLKEETPWQQRSMNMYGRQVLQPRMTAWYGTRRYTYSGIVNDPLPWTPLLDEVRGHLEKFIDGELNSALLNYYRDGNDSIGFHADDEPELGPIIVSLSFGHPRTIIFKHNKSLYPDVKIDQPDQTGILMMGDTQKNWKHGINKKKNVGERINVTFRQII